MTSVYCNDFVFKLFARKLRSRGIFVFGVGVVWSLMGWLFLKDKCGVWEATLLWGIVSGFFSVTGNLLLIEAMGLQSAGLCATIYRLNLALVVPGAALLFHEVHPWYQYIGIAAAIGAVLLFLPGSGNSGEAAKKSYLGIVLVIIAAVLRAGMGLSYKYGFNLGASPNGVNVINGLCWVVGGIVYYLLKERKMSVREAFSPKVFNYGALSGLLVFGIVFFMSQSVNLGDAGIVLPIAQMSFVLTFILSVLFLHEKFTLCKVLAISSGAAALLLLSI